ncbi:hypothetical protein NUITMVP1_30720 [Proteus mirabilis]|uniref:hypothetical protein n=1 Tax=Proteus mirabilis TaxID=584 RepID=UPI0021FE0441|nr:hypothetical protein [Proteus mirabilis]BDR99163.1 hypothetical protein NUITMVP1_30720 [Proteus mirabilis]
MYIKRVISIVNFLNFYLEKKTYNSFIEKNNFDIVVNNNIYSNLERILFEKSENLAYFVNFHNSPNEVFSRKDFFSIIPLHKIFSNVNLLAVSNGAKDELQNISFK